MTPDEAVTCRTLYHRRISSLWWSTATATAARVRGPGAAPAAPPPPSATTGNIQLTVSGTQWHFYDYLLVQSRRSSPSRASPACRARRPGRRHLAFRLCQIHRGCLPKRPLSGQQAAVTREPGAAAARAVINLASDCSVRSHSRATATVRATRRIQISSARCTVPAISDGARSGAALRKCAPATSC